jgi:hypothetical protein
MSAETIANLASKQSRNALQRLDQVENVLTNHSQAVNNLQNQFGQYVAIVDAMVELLGVETVTAKVKENAEKKALEQKASEESQVQSLLGMGVLVFAQNVSEKSVVVGQEIKRSESADEVLFPGRQQVVLSNPKISQDVKNLLLGKVVGDEVSLPGGNFYKLTEIYDIVDEAARKVTEPVDVAASEVPLEAVQEEVAVAPV